MNARRLLAAAAILVAAAALGVRSAPAGSSVLPRARGATHGTEISATTGPVAAEPPPGATVARDEAHLRQLIDEGPAEIWLEARTYRTSLLVRRALSLRGRKGATLEGPGQGTVLSVRANDVVIDNLVVRGSGKNFVSEDAAVRARGERVTIRHLFVDGTLFGVTLEACAACVVEDSHVRGADVAEVLRGDGIKLWEAHDSVVRRNYVERVRDIVVWYSRKARLEHNVVRGSRYGTHFMYAHDSAVRESTLLDNVVGVFVMYSARLSVEDNVLAGARGAAGMGLGFKESDGVSVSGNTIVANTTGLFLDRSPLDPTKHVVVRDNGIRLNQVAIALHGDANGVSFLANDLVNNASLIDITGGGDAMKLEFAGNHFSEYVGYDLDRDGAGDVPFTHARLSSELASDHPQIAFVHGTVAMTLLDVVARTFPLLSPRRILVDGRPAMRPLRSTK
ncbi:MAG: nitrous oxide reductase family maturation protein NosD [Deltaproteobacteria bacterium]|nr:nitrous oxide reductase family maturation protein NosD [Deltaproteobacteria bacterium]